MNTKFVSALTTIVFVTVLIQLVQPSPKSSILQTSLGRISDSFSRKISYNRIDVLYLASAKEEEQSAPTPIQQRGRRR